MVVVSVHRIGRTGRRGKRGTATTFINKTCETSVLLDLKHLLIEAKQKVPPFLIAMESETENYLEIGGNILAIRLAEQVLFVFKVDMTFWQKKKKFC